MGAPNGRTGCKAAANQDPKVQNEPTTTLAPVQPAPERLAPAQPSPGQVRIKRNRQTGTTRVTWTVDARNLNSSDKIAVSPEFGLSVSSVSAAPRPFKMILSPAMDSHKKGGGSFR